jgi:hypothetical protein
LIGQVRRDVTETLDQLEALLPASASLDDDGFWVVRGRANILIRARAMVEAGGGDGLLQVDRGEEDIESLVTTARGGGLTIAPASAGSILLLASGEALVGTLLPSHHCQAVVSRNSALLQALAPDHASSHQRPSRTTDASSDWLTWEWEKQRSILRLDNRRKGA